MGNKIKVLCLLVCLALFAPLVINAEGFDKTKTGSISVTMKDQSETPIEGVVFSLYYVATVDLNSDGNLSYAFSDQFKNKGIELSDPALLSKLDQLVDESFISSAKATTDADGKAVFQDLALGYYFVKQTNSVQGYAQCSSFLVTVPSKNGDEYIYDVNASPKTDIVRLVDITIKKVWNTDESTEIADQVTVQFLKEDVLIETVTLNDQNNWEAVLEGIPESDAYHIVEVDVPKGFTATYSQSGTVFTVTNSASLIHTGQIIWPIPVLAMAGLILIAAGVAILSRERKYHA